MRNFIIEQSPSEIYTSAASLTLVGQCLNKHTPLPKSARSLPKRHGIANIDLIRTYLGLVVTGKSDFEVKRSPLAVPGESVKSRIQVSDNT